MCTITVEFFIDLILNFSWPPRVFPDREWHQPGLELAVMYVFMIGTFALLYATRNKDPIHPDHPDYKKESIFVFFLLLYKKYSNKIKLIIYNIFNKVKNTLLWYYNYSMRFLRVCALRNLRKVLHFFKTNYKIYSSIVAAWWLVNKDIPIKELLRSYLRQIFAYLVLHFKNNFNNLYFKIFGDRSYISKHLSSRWMYFCLFPTVSGFLDLILKIGSDGEVPEVPEIPDSNGSGALDDWAIIEGMIYAFVAFWVIDLIESRYQKREPENKNPKPYTFLRKVNKQNKKKNK